MRENERKYKHNVHNLGLLLLLNVHIHGHTVIVHQLSATHNARNQFFLSLSMRIVVSKIFTVCFALIFLLLIFSYMIFSTPINCSLNIKYWSSFCLFQSFDCNFASTLLLPHRNRELFYAHKSHTKQIGMTWRIFH